MTSPHVDLGNSEQDAGQGLNTFAAGLLAQRQRQQQIAMQEALAKSQAAHLDAMTNTQIPAMAVEAGARTDYLGSQTEDAAAQAAQREAGNQPADDDDEARLREVDPSAPHGIYRGYTKAMANEHTKTIANYMAAKQRIATINERFYAHGQVQFDDNGNGMQVFPNQPGGGNVQPIPGVSKPLSVAERKAAGGWHAAKTAHDDMISLRHSNPEAVHEISKIVSLPSLAGLIPLSSQGLREAADNFRLSGATPAAQALVKRMFDFVGNAGPTRYGLRGMQNPRTLAQLWADFGYGQFGLTDAGMNAADKNRINVLIQMQEAAGPRAAGQVGGVADQYPDQPLIPKQNPYTK